MDCHTHSRIVSMHEFNQSLKYDRRMYAADVAGSISYARALAKGGILTEDEKNKIVDGLTRVRTEWEQGIVRHRCDSMRTYPKTASAV